MAVLNKIRQRSVFLILVIALALFAFVLADVIRNGGFSSQKSQNTVGTVNDEDISREEFARQVEAFQQNAGQNVTTTQAVNQVWEQKLREVIIDDELEKLGVRVGEAQIRQLMETQMANNPTFLNEAGQFDENRLREYVSSIRSNSPQAYQQWLEFENSLDGTARENLYFTMVSAGVGATLTEGELAYHNQNDNVDLEYVQIPFSSVSDDEVEVSKAEIREYVENHAARFETEASRDIRYVFFEEEASEEDREEAREGLISLMGERVEFNSAANANDTLPGFEATDDYDTFLAENSDIPYQDRFVFKNELPSEFRDDIFNLEEGETFGPYEHNTSWKITKMVETREIPDSIKASHILVAYQGLQFAPDVTRSKEEAETLADSLANVVRNNNSKFAELAAEFSADKSNSEEGGDLGYFGPGDMVPEFDEFVLENNKGDIEVIETDFGYHVVHIVEQSDRKRAVKTATLARAIEASSNTGNELFNKATKFEIAAKEGDFAEEAEAEDLNVRSVENINALDETIRGLGAQRSVIQWTFEEDAKAGDVRRFDIAGGYVVAQLTAKREKGLMSAEEASSEVLPILEKEKKAEIIKQKLNGDKLQEIAASQNQVVQNAKAVTLNNPTLPGAGREPGVIGAVFAMEAGVVSKPITGEKGVYVVELVSKNKAPERESYRNIAEQETQSQRQQASRQAYEALKKKAEIEDNRARFY